MFEAFGVGAYLKSERIASGRQGLDLGKWWCFTDRVRGQAIKGNTEEKAINVERQKNNEVSMEVRMLKDKTVSDIAKSHRERPSGRPLDLELKSLSVHWEALERAT